MPTNDDTRIPKELYDRLLETAKQCEINVGKAIRKYRELDAKYDKDTGHREATIVALRASLAQAQDKLAKAAESRDSSHRLIEFMGEQLNEGRDRENKYVDSLWDNHNREELNKKQSPDSVWNRLSDTEQDILSALTGQSRRSAEWLADKKNTGKNIDEVRKCLATMKSKGWVESKEGRSGGYWLTENAPKPSSAH